MLHIKYETSSNGTEHKTHGHINSMAISSKYLVTSPTLQWHTRLQNTVQCGETQHTICT